MAAGQKQAELKLHMSHKIPCQTPHEISPFTRPLLSSIEKDVLNDFIKNLTATESQFCCGGTIKHPADQKLSLFYKAEGNAQAHR